MEKICENLDFCAGTLKEDIEDFYYDTRFKSFDEAYEWALEHNCTHVYDSKEDKFISICEEEEKNDIQKSKTNNH